MKTIILLFISTLFWCSHSVATENYIYPPLYTKPIEPCKRFRQIEKQIEVTEEEPDFQQYISRAIDLNNDGVCELFLTSPKYEIGNSIGWEEIYRTDGAKYEKIGQVTGYWLGKERNGYARIFEPAASGHRTNPTFTLNVLYFDGNYYSPEYISKLTYGNYRNKALKAYKTKDYETARKYYLNAYRFNKEKYLKDANNLALVLIKQNMCKDATQLLNKHLKNISSDDKDYIKSAKHNLKLCAN